MTAATLTRFDLHRQKRYALPEVNGNFPKLLTKAMGRVEKFFNMRDRWRIRTIKATSAAAALRTATEKLARDQRRHTDTEITKLFLSRLNVQTDHPNFSWLQIRWTSIEDICLATGFSRSTVTASIRRLKLAGVLRTQRRKNPTKDREWVAVRWLTREFFELLGLGGWLNKQKKGNTDPDPVPEFDPLNIDALDDDHPAKLLQQSIERERRRQAEEDKL